MGGFHIDNYLGSAIIGAIGLTIKFIASMAYSLQDISIKITQVHDIIKDHELRLRVIEHNKE